MNTMDGCGYNCTTCRLDTGDGCSKCILQRFDQHASDIHPCAFGEERAPAMAQMIFKKAEGNLYAEHCGKRVAWMYRDATRWQQNLRPDKFCPICGRLMPNTLQIRQQQERQGIQ